MPFPLLGGLDASVTLARTGTGCRADAGCRLPGDPPTAIGRHATRRACD